METATKNSSAVEVTREEWSSRKMTKYGYFSALFDILYVILNFAAMGAIVSYMIVSTLSQGQIYFWQIFVTILFIQGLRAVARVLNPLNSYQTVIIRE